ncbi:hypothetical protein QTP86_023019, partial [Hemibagrus guttatus]
MAVVVNPGLDRSGYLDEASFNPELEFQNFPHSTDACKGHIQGFQTLPPYQKQVQKEHERNMYIETTSKCKLTPGKTYRPCCKSNGRDYVHQPEEDTFECDYGPNYHPTFEVLFNTEVNEVMLSLLDENGRVVWTPRMVLLTVEYHVVLALKHTDRSSDDHFEDSRDTRHMWQGITNYKTTSPACDSDASLPDVLNDFYARFEVQNNVAMRKTIPPFNDLSASSQQPSFPMLKKSLVSCLNDYHPITLIPFVMKCFERLIMRHIKTQLPPSLEYMQFANWPNRSRDDAITTTLHLALTHLDNKDNSAQSKVLTLWKAVLIQRVPSVMEIADCIKSKEFPSEIYNKIDAEATSEDQMRELYKYLISAGQAAKAEFYQILQQKHLELVTELESGSGEMHPLSEVRIVLLGCRGAGKSSAGNTILGREEFDLRGSAQCVMRQGEVAGRQITVVEAPGWQRDQAVQQLLKQEIELSVSMRPSGPHAVLLVMRLDLEFTEKERQEFVKYVDLLGPTVWSHTIFLFTFGDSLGDTSIERHIESEGQALQWLVEKCGNRYHVFNNKKRDDVSQVSELLEKIEEMVAENKGCPLFSAFPDTDNQSPKIILHSETHVLSVKCAQSMKIHTDHLFCLQDSVLMSDSDESRLDDKYRHEFSDGGTSRSEDQRKPGAVQGVRRALKLLWLPAGQFKCKFSDLVFDMKGEGRVMYKIVSWDSHVLDGLRHMEPAGPLYSIECLSSTIHRLHLPHCETRTDVVELTVAHVTGINVEILQPLKVTNTHVIIEIQHLSCFGLLKLLKLLAYPIRAQVLLFYEKSLSKLHIHLLKRKIPVEEVQNRHESITYIPTSSKCILTPGEKYRPCCKTADREYVSQPKDETFDRDRDPNYHPTFEVFLNTEVNKVTLSLLDEKGVEVWKPHDVVLTGADFVDKHKADLIQRVPSVMEIVDCIRSKGFTACSLHSKTESKQEDCHFLSGCWRCRDRDVRSDGLQWSQFWSSKDSDSSGLSSDSDESISDDDYTSNDVPTSWGSRSEEKRQPGAVQGLTRALRDFRLHAGQFKCRFTDLVFDMEREGTVEVMRKIVSWDSRVLDGLRHMEPAGPLYSIECHKGSIRRLHLPHCETRTNVVKLTVAHVSDGNVEILQPLKVTSTHVIIEVQNLSLFGLLKTLLLPAYPIRAQVLLFFEKSLSKLHIHLLPGNVPVQEVQKRHESIRYITTSSRCRLTPGKKYRPCCKTTDHDYVSQPEDEMFECDYGPNYHPTFEVFFKTEVNEVRLSLLDDKGLVVWTPRDVMLTGTQRSTNSKDSPARDCLYHLTRPEREAMIQYIHNSLAAWIIHPFSSPAGVGFFFVEKKDKSLCPCIDYWGLNTSTIMNCYPLPHMSLAFEFLQGATMFTKLDLRNAYHLVRIQEGDEWKAALNIPSGHYEYLVMRFGLTNAPAVFQALVNDVLRDMINRDIHHLSEVRILLMGCRNSGKSSSGNTILGQAVFDFNRAVQCVKRHGEVAGRKITVVEVPGWCSDRPVEESTELLKQEIGLSASLCLPGPHVVLVVVNGDMTFTEKDREILAGYLMLLCDDVWSHTIALFTFGDSLGDTSIERHIESEGKALQWLVAKCGNRYHVFNNKMRYNNSQVMELLKKVENMVAENRECHLKMDNKLLQDVEKRRRREEKESNQRRMKIMKGDTCHLPEVRIVLLGSRNSGKSSSGNTILGQEVFDFNRAVQCVKRHGEVAGRKITVVEAPGWCSDRPVEDSTKLLKQEIVLSVSQCPPGPHAVLVVVNGDRTFTEKDREIFVGYQNLLSDEVWSHTIVLFTFGDSLRDTTIERHIESEGKALQWLLEKCRNRYQVFDNKIKYNTQITELLEKIEKIVAGNRGCHLEMDTKTLQDVEERRRQDEEGSVQRRMKVSNQREDLRKHTYGIHHLSEIRIVLLGSRNSGKSSSGNTILGIEEFDFNRVVQCVKRHGEVAGRKITVVEAPGWCSDRPVEESTKLLKQEIVLSVSQCPPGPHAVLVVVNGDRAFTEKDRQILAGYLSLLGDKFWSHTIVLFTFGDSLGDTSIERHIESEGQALQWLVEKCRNRYHVFNNMTMDNSQVTELLEKIAETVSGNRGCHLEMDTKIVPKLKEKDRTEEEIPNKRMTKGSMFEHELQLPMQSFTGILPGHMSIDWVPWVLYPQFQKHAGEMHHLSEVRIVLLGCRTAGKSSSGNTILGKQEFDMQENTQCMKRHGEVANRKITVVEAPGWCCDKPVEESTESLKQEIGLSASQCPPGPHAVLAVVNGDRSFTEKDREIFVGYLSLLSDKVWSHTIVLFTFGDSLGDTTIEQHIESEGQALQWLVEKCGNRYHVFNNIKMYDDSQVKKLLEIIETMVAGNRGCHLEMDLKPLQEVDAKIAEDKISHNMLKQGSWFHHEFQLPMQSFTRIPLDGMGIAWIPWVIQPPFQKHTGDIYHLSEVRIVLLGSRNSGKSSSGNTILGQEVFDFNRAVQCVTRHGEVAGRKITVVEAPGWCSDRPVEDSTKLLKQEIVLSVSQCPPGPNAVLVVVNGENAFSEKDHEILLGYQNLLSDKVWSHTIVLFTFGDSLGDTSIEQHIECEGQALQWLVEKCRNRYHVFNNKMRHSNTQVMELLMKIEKMGAENRGCHLQMDNKILQDVKKKRRQEEEKLLERMMKVFWFKYQLELQMQQISFTSIPHVRLSNPWIPWGFHPPFQKHPGSEAAPHKMNLTGADFVNEHREILIQRVSSVMEIADCLKGKDMISEEMYICFSRFDECKKDTGSTSILQTPYPGQGKVELADMMERRKVDILCVQETRWKGSKARSIGAGFKLFYYGVDSKRNGVGVVLKEGFVRNVLEVKRVSDRVMSLKLEIEGVMLNVVSGYDPQVGCELDEKERFWSELDEVMESIPTGERVVIGADFNEHVGERNTGDEEVMGKFGVKERNLKGQMVVDFAKRMDMAVVNTYFQKREEHRVAYKSGGRRTQKKKRSEIEKKTKWWKLKKKECCAEFRQKLRQALGGQVVLPDDWETTAEVIRETGRKVLGVSSGRRKEDKETWWWNEEVQDSIQRKRLAKKKWDMDRTEENRQEYKESQHRVKREVSKAKQKGRINELYTRLDIRGGEKDLYRVGPLPKSKSSHKLSADNSHQLKPFTPELDKNCEEDEYCHFLQLFRRDPKAFPGQPKDIVSSACPGSSPGPLPGGACPEHLSRETSWRHPKQMPEPPQLPPFDVEEQRLYSELLPGDRAPYPISKGAPCHPTEEAHFGRLYPGSYPFGHDPELMAIDRYIDPHYCCCCTDPSVNLTIHPSLTREQDPEILKLLHLRKDLPSNLKGASHLFPVENHGLGFGGADPHPSRFTLSCKTPQCM